MAAEVEEIDISTLSEKSENEKSSLPSPTNLTGFVVGGTGEVGKELVKKLVQNPNFSKVVLISRREINFPSENDYTKVEQKIVNFDDLKNHSDAFAGTDVGFCCLGTTRAAAGADGFVKVDHGYVLDSAKMAKESGCEEFHLVSSTGANKDSYFLYPQTKGRVEHDIKELGFKHLFIYQPGLLLCERAEPRFGEKLLRVAMSALDYSRMHSISTEDVAKSMLACALKKEKTQIRLLSNSDIKNEAALSI